MQGEWSEVVGGRKIRRKRKDRRRGKVEGLTEAEAEAEGMGTCNKRYGTVNFAFLEEGSHRPSTLFPVFG